MEELVSAALAIYQTAVDHSTYTSSPDEVYTTWQAVVDMYADKDLLEFNFGNSVPGQFGLRVAAIFSESPFSMLAGMAILSLKAAVLAEMEVQAIEQVLSPVHWRVRF
jgi:hypothetical protein